MFNPYFEVKMSLNIKEYFKATFLADIDLHGLLPLGNSLSEI